MVASGGEHRHRPEDLLNTASNSRRVRAAALGLLVALGGCYNFRQEGPENPDPVPIPRLVDVSIEYRQPPECVEGSPRERCQDNVVFFGSWMRDGEEFLLRPDPGRFIWRGTALRVPVNFPPRDGPYRVVVFDPHQAGSPTEGFTAEHLRVGDEVITRYDAPGGPREVGLIFIDENGFGRSPF
jgi:hypothetical protein